MAPRGEVTQPVRRWRRTALRHPLHPRRVALHLLADLALRGDRAAVAFVVQRGDVERLLVGPHADPTWVEAVRSAAEAGVAVLAFRCAVGTSTITLDRPLPVVLGDVPVRV